jgi:hypothetical protein
VRAFVSPRTAISSGFCSIIGDGKAAIWLSLDEKNDCHLPSVCLTLFICSLEYDHLKLISGLFLPNFLSNTCPKKILGIGSLWEADTSVLDLGGPSWTMGPPFLQW